MCCLCLWWPTTKRRPFFVRIFLGKIKFFFFPIFICTHTRQREQGHSRFPLNAGKITTHTRKEKEIRRNRRRNIIFQDFFFFLFLFCFLVLSLHPSRRNKKMGLSEFRTIRSRKRKEIIKKKNQKGNYMVC